MINVIPIVGWLISFVFSASLSVPFWFCWTRCGLGAKYFYWLPDIYLHIPFWNCVGLFIVISILKNALTPKLVDVSQTNKKEE